MARDKGVIWVEREEGLFLRTRLDRPNQLDPARQIRCCAHGPSGGNAETEEDTAQRRAQSVHAGIPAQAGPRSVASHGSRQATDASPQGPDRKKVGLVP